MIKRMWLVVALLLGVLGILSAVPAGADIPTNIVDQYWTWNRGAPGTPNFWIEQINKINTVQPVWNPKDATGQELGYATLWLDNKEIPDWHKNIWVEVKFVLPRTEVPTLTVKDPNGVVYTPSKTWLGGTTGSSQFTTCQWQLPWQPDWEYIQFDSFDYYRLNGIEIVEVATQCVPEPMSIMLGALGLGAVGGLRKLRRK